jgi:GNAT superfamily N-acetyltransferase
MKIKSVENNKDLLKFIKFQWEIYKDDKYWVPQLISDMMMLLDENKNLFWKHAEKKLFFIEDDTGKILGRVAGVIDHNFIKFHNEQTGFFAFFECINDKNVSSLLLSSVEMWLKEKGIKKIIGPTAPSTNDEMGLLYEGYDSEPFLMMPHNPRYYHNLVLSYGFKKAKDLYAYLWTNAENSLPIERLTKVVNLVKNKYPELKLREVNLKNFSEELKVAVEIYNEAWEKNWGFVPWTEEEFVSQALRLKPLVDPRFIIFAYLGNEPVGMLIAVPNYNEVLKKLNGRLGLVEIIKFLYYKNKIKSIRVMIMGVKKKFRNKGFETVMFLDAINKGLYVGYEKGEFSWILEDNTMMVRAAEMLGTKLHKKYRVYEKSIL